MRSVEPDQSNPVPVGKLPADLLKKMLAKFISADPRVLVGPALGIDAAIIEMGDRCLVAKTDPVTFASDEIGWYAVHVNANDIACCGATPRWFLATILLPAGSTTDRSVEAIFSQLASACRQLGVSLCGGHTEITHGLERPIVIGHMLGEVAPNAYITCGGAQVGDALILTKGIAIEGTAILAREKRHELRVVLSEAELQRCADFLHAPGISVVQDARLALQVGGVHALHDPTEGGLATGLREMAEAAKVGIMVHEDRIPILPECARVCRHFGLDPLGLIASGSLLIAAATGHAEAIVGQLTAAGIAATVFGEVVPVEYGSVLRSVDQTHRPLPSFGRDEITRVFEG